MFNKFELIGAGVSVFFMALAIYLVQVETTLFQSGKAGQSAQVIESAVPDVVIVSESDEKLEQELTYKQLIRRVISIVWL